jgi:hypothetical protein
MKILTKEEEREHYKWVFPPALAVSSIGHETSGASHLDSTANSHLEAFTDPLSQCHPQRRHFRQHRRSRRRRWSRSRRSPTIPFLQPADPAAEGVPDNFGGHLYRNHRC